MVYYSLQQSTQLNRFLSRCSCSFSGSIRILSVKSTKNNAEINQNKTQKKKKKNAVYKLKFCGFRLGAMTPSTGKLLYCNDNGGED